VRMSEGGPARHAGTRPEVEVIATIAQRIMGDSGPIDWQSMRDTGFIRTAIARVVPGFDKIEKMEETKQSFQIEGRTFHEKKFSTESEKLVLHEHELPALRGGAEGELRLTTIRSEGQFNTVVYEEEDLYRGIERRDVILIHPDDCRRLGVKHEQSVTITSECGRLENYLVQEFPDIKPGNVAMYYPEANMVVPRIYDPQSETPAFKSVTVRVTPFDAAARVS
jgi:anaerobic selenocysteine-containing dehydrogenase